MKAQLAVILFLAVTVYAEQNVTVYAERNVTHVIHNITHVIHNITHFIHEKEVNRYVYGGWFGTPPTGEEAERLDAAVVEAQAERRAIRAEMEAMRSLSKSLSTETAESFIQMVEKVEQLKASFFNGIKDGAWKDMNDKIAALEASNKRLEEKLDSVKNDTKSIPIMHAILEKLEMYADWFFGEGYKHLSGWAVGIQLGTCALHFYFLMDRTQIRDCVFCSLTVITAVGIQIILAIVAHYSEKWMPQLASKLVHFCISGLAFGVWWAGILWLGFVYNTCRQLVVVYSHPRSDTNSNTLSEVRSSISELHTMFSKVVNMVNVSNRALPATVPVPQPTRPDPVYGSQSGSLRNTASNTRAITAPSAPPPYSGDHLQTNISPKDENAYMDAVYYETTQRTNARRS